MCEVACLCDMYLNLHILHCVLSLMCNSIQNVGCDGCLGSNVKYDVCGVCGGNGSSCTLSSHIFIKRLTQFGEFAHVSLRLIYIYIYI